MNLPELKLCIHNALAYSISEVVQNCGEYYSPYYSLLYFLARGCDGICVELGVDKGRGVFAMLEAEARVFGVEQNDKECFSMSHPNLTLLKCSSTPVPQAIQEAGQIAVLHIDTEHSYARARDEFEAYKSFLKDGAVVCFDDTNAMEGDVLRYVESLPYEKIVEDRLHPQCGFAVMIYREGL